MAPLLPDRHVIWNEDIHTFEPVGFNRFIHYARSAASRNKNDDRPSEPRYMNGDEVDAWIKARNLPPIDQEYVDRMTREWESGTFGPPDNPRSDTKPEEPNV